MIIPTDSKLTKIFFPGWSFYTVQACPGSRCVVSALLQLAEWCASLPLHWLRGRVEEYLVKNES